MYLLYKYVVNKVVKYNMGYGGLCLSPLRAYSLFSSAICFIFFLKPLGFPLGVFSKRIWFMVHPFAGFVRDRFKGGYLKYCAWP